MQPCPIAVLFLVQWMARVISQFFLDGHAISQLGFGSYSLFTWSFSPHHGRRFHPSQFYHQQSHIRFGALRGRIRDGIVGYDIIQSPNTSPPTSDNNTTSETSVAVDITSINEAQLLLACRSWLLRKHKLEWKEKKRRVEAAASPLNNEGYFWPDPNDLLYLREDPDPYNLNYNETYSEYYGFKRNGVRFLTSRDTTYSGKNYFETAPTVEERASISDNPFSTNPVYPSDEHTRRSNAKLRLWNNSTWKQEWYNRRWRGKVATYPQNIQKKQNKLLRGISNEVIESPLFDSMSEVEVTDAILTYLISNHRKSESQKSNKDKRKVERESFREWREQVKQEARDAPMNQTIAIQMKAIARKVSSTSNNTLLSFTPSVSMMTKLKKKRSEKSRRAFQARLSNNKAAASTSKKITLRRTSNAEVDSGRGSDNDEFLFYRVISPVQALLHIDMELDHNRMPKTADVEIVLKPGRLGRRRDTLRRILSECYDLRGKCVPALSGGELFVTKCTIDDLGAFVLSKLRQTS